MATADKSTFSRVAMVSGANRGIGQQVAMELGRRGFRLSLGVRDPKALNRALPECASAFAFAYEAQQRDAGRLWVDATMAEFGRIDVVVSNAGICPYVDLEEGLDSNDDTDSALDDLLEINVKAPFRLVRAALPHLRVAGNGRVIQLASLSGKRVKNGNVGYQMSKHAVIALNHAVRRAGWKDGVRSTAICPGYVNTDMAASADIPGEAMTQPEDLALLIANTIDMPNTASVAEILVNCRHEDLF
jgi:NAD(P)-dependent dehydrogenase (short-subunit alcohol dehydrogenase family)